MTSQFSLEELYGVSRAEYCEITGITPSELRAHLGAEVEMLEKAHEKLQKEFREGGSITESVQRYRASLLQEMNRRAVRKLIKIKELSTLQLVL